MKQTKKVVGIVLALILALSAFGVVAIAQGEEDAQTVAVIYHCASGIRAPYIFGHTWIVIKNVCDRNLTVGPQTIEPGGMISAGLHSGKGMDFNREMREFSGRAVTALQYQMTVDDLRKAEEEIMSSRWDHYLLFSHNCTNFSTSVWKAVTGQKYSPFIFPFVIKNQFPSDETIKLFIP